MTIWVLTPLTQDRRGMSSRKCQAKATRGENNFGCSARETLVRDFSAAGDWGG